MIHGGDSYSQLRSNVKNRIGRYPEKNDGDQFDGISIIPRIKPKFKIARGDRIFTIGSCFAREIETALQNEGFVLPVKKFSLPAGEMPDFLDAAQALNEYGSGTIRQRIEHAFGEFSYPDESGVEQTPDGVRDLYLHSAIAPASHDRLMERRRQVEETYRALHECDVVVLTLGLIEGWFDTLCGTHLNAAPSYGWVTETGDRFLFHRMDYDEIMNNMVRVFDLLGDKKIILTVSPIPLQTTFMPENVILASTYGKSLLRVCADVLSKRFDNVDYFPSYEIVTSAGTTAFWDDNRHVNRTVVGKIMSHLLETYTDK
jgi:hypothetical protein